MTIPGPLDVLEGLAGSKRARARPRRTSTRRMAMARRKGLDKPLRTRTIPGHRILPARSPAAVLRRFRRVAGAGRTTTTLSARRDRPEQREGVGVRLIDLGGSGPVYTRPSSRSRRITSSSEQVEQDFSTRSRRSRVERRLPESSCPSTPRGAGQGPRRHRPGDGPQADDDEHPRPGVERRLFVLPALIAQVRALCRRRARQAAEVTRQLSARPTRWPRPSTASART